MIDRDIRTSASIGEGLTVGSESGRSLYLFIDGLSGAAPTVLRCPSQRRNVAIRFAGTSTGLLPRLTVPAMKPLPPFPAQPPAQVAEPQVEQARADRASQRSKMGHPAEGLPRLGSSSDHDDARRPGQPADADALVAGMRAIALDESGGANAMVDFDVRLHFPVAQDRSERLRAVAQRVAEVASAQETLMRRIDAQVQQTYATRQQQLLPAAAFVEQFEQGAQASWAGVGGMRRVALAHLDAAAAWREAADRHAVALGAAQKFSVDDVEATSATAMRVCEAAANRSDLLGSALMALSTHRHGQVEAGRGNFRAMELTADKMRAMIDEMRDHDPKMLQDAGFEQPLAEIAGSAMMHLRRIGSAQSDDYSGLVPPAFRSASQIPVWRSRFAAAALDLLHVTESLRAILQGDARASALPAPSLPALLAAASGAEERAMRSSKAPATDGELTAWLGALGSYAELSDAVARVSAQWQSDGPAEQGLRGLQQQVEDAIGRCMNQVRGIVDRASDSLHGELLAADASSAGGNLQQLRTAAEGIAQRAFDLQFQIAKYAVLQRQGIQEALPATTLAQPFVVLELVSRAVGESALRFGREEAAALRQAAAVALAGSAVPSAPGKRIMVALASYCNNLANDVLSARADIEHESTKEFLRQAWPITLAAERHVDTLLTGLHGVLAAEQSGQHGNRMAVEPLRAVLSEAQARLKVVELPEHAPPRALATQRATQLMMRATLMAAEVLVEAASVCGQALQELPRVAPRQRSVLAQALAEKVRVAGATVASVLAEQINFGAAMGVDDLAKVVSDQGTKLRHVERLAQRVRVSLQALALMFEGQRDAETFRTSVNSLPLSQSITRIQNVARQYSQADAILKASAQQLVTRILSDKATGDAPIAPLLDAEAVAVMQSFEALGFHASRERELAHGRLLVDLVQRTLADREQTRNLGRVALSEVVDLVQQHLDASANSIAGRLGAGGNRDTLNALQEKAEGLQRELHVCREQLPSITSDAPVKRPSRAQYRRR